jgi:surfactin synthase thioesterase subunit
LPYLPSTIEVVAVKAPGREDRIAEEPLRTVAPLADRCAETIVGYAHRPFAFFGHSMGALLAREVAARLRSSRLTLLAVAGAAAPDRHVPSYAEASDEQILALLSEWGGTPAAVLTDPSVYSLFMPCLRADFAVAESCRRPLAPDDPLDVPVLALAGSEDRAAAPAECAHWSRWTRGPFTIRVVTGGHFFPFTAAAQLLPMLTSRLVGQDAGAGHRRSPGERPH